MVWCCFWGCQLSSQLFRFPKWSLHVFLIKNPSRLIKRWATNQTEGVYVSLPYSSSSLSSSSHYKVIWFRVILNILSQKSQWSPDHQTRLSVWSSSALLIIYSSSCFFDYVKLKEWALAHRLRYCLGNLHPKSVCLGLSAALLSIQLPANISWEYNGSVLSTWMTQMRIWTCDFGLP